MEISYNNTEIKTGAKKVKQPESYKKNKYSPNLGASPKEKDKPEYAQAWVERIYNLYQNKNGWIQSSLYSDIDLLRSYVDGNQPTDQYKSFIVGNTQNEANKVFDGEGYDVRNSSSTATKRQAWINLDYKPVSIGPKLMTKINEQIRGLYYEMNLNAVDSNSVMEEEHAKYRLWFEKENNTWLKSQYALMQIAQQEPQFVPLNLNELELYASTGGFKLPYAVNMEGLLKHTFDVSEWDKEVQERVAHDLCSVGYSLVREYYDPEDKREKIKYVNLKYGGIQYNATKSFKDSEYGFELEWWEISKAMQKFNLTRDQAASLAFAFSGQFGNPTSNEWKDYAIFNDVTGTLNFDFYKVPVFRCEWVDIDNEKYIEHVTENGRKIIKPYSETSENQNYKNSHIRYVREATWIVGTNYLTDYGKVKYIPRMNPKKPRISYRGIRLLAPSLFMQIRPLLDGLQNAWLKTQQAIAIAVSNGLAVDVGAIKNISIGKDKSWDALEVLKFYRQQSILLYSKRNTMNIQSLSSGGAVPITPLITKMEDNIKAQFGIMDKFMEQIESFTGLNMVSTGETPEKGLGKFNMQVALQGSNQIINSLARAITDLKADVSENVVCRLRSLIKSNPDIQASYESVIGKHRMKSILMAEKNNVEYGIKIEARDITEMKAFIDAILQTSLKPSPGAAGQLDVSDALIIKDMVEQKQNIRRIALYVGYMLRKKNMIAQQQQLEAIQTQNKGLQQLEQMKEQGKAKDRAFEMAKIQKEFENQYMLEHGINPSAAMNTAKAVQPPPQPQQQQPQVPEQVPDQQIMEQV